MSCTQKPIEWEVAREYSGRGFAVTTDPERGGIVVSPEPVLVPPGEQRSVTFTADLGWDPLDLVVVQECAHLFEVVSMRCARMSLSASHNPVPCELFSSALCQACRTERVAKRIVTNWPRVFPGSPFELVVRNRSDQPATFRAGFGARWIPSPGTDRLDETLKASRERCL